MSEIRTRLDELVSPNTIKELAKDTTESLLTRTRKGYGAEKTGGRIVRFKSLSQSTINTRRKYSNLSAYTSASKSNLTATGTMLKDLGYKVSNKSFTIGFKSARSDNIARHHQEGRGKLPKRPFMFLSNVDIEALNEALNTLAQKIIGSV